MKRTIVRLQVLLLLLAVGLVGYRVLDGTPPPEGTLVLHSVDEDALVSGTLRITGEPQRVAVHAVGSFASSDATRLEAYAWLVDRESREVVWQMTPEGATRLRGTVAEQRDTVMLGPGTYDAFFTSYGNERSDSEGWFDLSRRWRANADRWKLVLRALGDPAFTRGGTFSGRWGRASWTEARPAPEGLVWTSAPEGEDDRTGTLLVRTPATLDVYAVGAFQPTQSSPLEIVPAGGENPIWRLPVDKTEPAGGARTNRRYTGRLTLEPGLYEIRYDPGHGWDRWHENPPLDPAAWGVTLSTADPEAVTLFEPFETASPTVAIPRPGDGVNRSADFEVKTRTPVLVYAMGEMTSSTSRYDYGWIERADGSRLWEMDYEDTERAGGGSKNRVTQQWITLDPGRYRLRYKSDGSHSYGGFNTSPPDHDDRWGISLFAATPEAVLRGDAADLGGETDGEAPPAPGNARLHVQSRAELVAPPPVDGATVALMRTGNRENLAVDFEVNTPGAFRVYATGEISGSARYDYATLWDSSGRLVWEMTGDNTIPAGGASRNRTFDGTIDLEPGRYTMRYETDGSHAYDDFSSDEAPTYPATWGVILRSLDR